MGSGAALSRPIYAFLGFLCLGLGYIGLVLPVMPGTIFFILALNCFRRSNAKMEAWLLARPKIGPVLQEWDRTGSIKPKVKALILFLMWGSMIGSAWKVHKLFADLGTRIEIWSILALCGIGVSWYILSRPSGVSVRDPKNS
ncbi:DUF454 domain-containing protein [bacterium]|nr:MAG: DUF454 domain-containing protein [bacterium]